MDQEFYTVDDVPLFHEDEDFDRQKLNEIVSVNNERASRGEGICLTVGHKKDKERACVGLVDNLQLRERNGLATVYGRYQLYPETSKTILKEYPRRSIEIWHNSCEMPAVALLGATPAAHDLGLVLKHKDKPQDQLLVFSKEKITVESLHNFETEGEPMVSDELKQQILEVLSETDVFAFVSQLMEDKKAEADETEEFSEDEKKADEPDAESKENKADEPAEKSDDKKDDEDEKKEFSKVSRELKTYENENQILKEQLRFFERKDQLTTLQREGFDIDVQEELTDSADLPDSQFGKLLDRIRKYSKRAPVGLNFDTTRIHKPKDQLSTSEIAAVQQIAKTKKLDFNSALQEFGKNN